jgi:hypothetical protein
VPLGGIASLGFGFSFGFRFGFGFVFGCVTYGFICLIFCLSLLLIKAFNTLDLIDRLNEFML